MRLERLLHAFDTENVSSWIASTIEELGGP